MLSYLVHLVELQEVLLCRDGFTQIQEDVVNKTKSSWSSVDAILVLGSAEELRHGLTAELNSNSCRTLKGGCFNCKKPVRSRFLTSSSLIFTQFMWHALIEHF